MPSILSTLSERQLLSFFQLVSNFLEAHFVDRPPYHRVCNEYLTHQNRCARVLVQSSSTEYLGYGRSTCYFTPFHSFTPALLFWVLPPTDLPPSPLTTPTHLTSFFTAYQRQLVLLLRLLGQEIAIRSHRRGLVDRFGLSTNPPANLTFSNRTYPTVDLIDSRPQSTATRHFPAQPNPRPLLDHDHFEPFVSRPTS